MRNPLQPIALVPVLCVLAGVVFAAEIPVAFPNSRYQAMIEKSPFSVGTAAPASVPAGPPPDSFAKDYYLVGVAKLNNKDFVTVACRVDQTQRFSLYKGEQGPDGISVVTVTWEPGVGKSKVTLKKGTEFGSITFDEAAQAGAMAEGQAPQMPPAPPVPGVPRTGARPPVHNGVYQPPNAMGRMMPNRSMVPSVRPFRPGANLPGTPQSRIRRPVIPSPR